MTKIPLAIIERVFYNCDTDQNRGGQCYMTEREDLLLKTIRESKDPAALLVVALEAITACLQRPEPSRSQNPAAPASVGGTDQ